MSGRVELYDWVTDTWYRVDNSARPPKARMRRYTHSCPDGTQVTVFAQDMRTSLLGCTVYRYWVGDRRVRVVRVDCPPSVPPDWGWVDSQYAAKAA